MINKNLKITFPNELIIEAKEGDDWFSIAKLGNFEIPKGCLVGSCGACEIDVNGETIRPCITKIKSKNSNFLSVNLTIDPYWA